MRKNCRSFENCRFPIFSWRRFLGCLLAVWVWELAALGLETVGPGFVWAEAPPEAKTPSVQKPHPTEKTTPPENTARTQNAALAENPGPAEKAAQIRKTAPAPKPYAPTSDYELMHREGWQVLVWKGLLQEHSEVAQEVLKLLDYHLYQIRRTLPRPAVEKLQKVRIWVEWEEGHHPCMAYHPNPAWLREHGMNPDKAKCVEIAHARNFLAWTKEQPWMVLHELAHAYHDQFLPGGYENPEIKAVYESAIKAGRYGQVLFVRGGRRQAYAAKNPMEYFAELSEAYFGTNDFYPFVRGELKEHDPSGFALLEKLWGLP